ncbi:MAG: 4-hydroxy-4-methyl-2-oxoglutarate aldolase [Frankiales bacterium]|nr:4-hydroxy-4-methyl-2-oxoglutarate aldolase [Frankiales bacterium]
MTPLATATAHEASGQYGPLPSGIKPVARGMRVEGPAFTVLCGQRDNLALHHAIASAPHGAVLVVQTGGWYDAGYLGDIMARAAAARGLGGLVLDACVRDLADLAAGDFPVFARGLSIRGTTKDPLLPAALGVRLRFPEVDVDPGDLVVGDDDGVVVLAAAMADDVRRLSAAREESEAEIRGRLDAGETTLEVYALPDLGGARLGA